MPLSKTIAVAGGTGDLGHVIVEKLAAAAGGEFDVKVLSRGSAQRFALPANVSVVTVDYSSLKSLTDALQGCYGVVDCLSGRSSLVTFEAVLDAAVAADVDRYITLSHARDPAARDELSPLLKAQNHLGSKLVATAEGGPFTFTAINSGSWIDYIMVFETMMSMPHRVFYMHEHPDWELSMCTRASLGDAVVATFQKPSETKNKFLYIEMFKVSQNRALELAKEAMPDTEFQIIQTALQERYERGIAAKAAGRWNDRRVYADIIAKLVFTPRPYDTPSNDLLGIPGFTDEEFKQLLRELAVADRYDFEVSM